jgi:enoyl-CoA hydratase
MGGGAHLQRLFPVQKVRHMYFTGEFIDAGEAWRLGAVETVVPREDLVAKAMSIAQTIAAKSPKMISLAKEALNAIEDGNLEEKYRREQGLTLEAYMHQDSQEGRDAFNEKRDTDFNESSQS